MTIQPSPYASRADEVSELLDAVKSLIIPFIRAADPTPSTSTSGKAPVRPVVVDAKDPKELRQILNLDLPQGGQGKDGSSGIVEKISQYSVNTWDQGFMDKSYASTNAVGVIAELILAVLNTNVHVYQVSPVLTLIEKHVSRELALLFGLDGPHAGGMTQPGGSASNSSSVIIARNTLYPETKRSGSGGRQFVSFTSAHGHYSLEKAAQIHGFGSDAVRPVPVDAQGRMDPAASRRSISKAKDHGEIPFYVNATAGTTVSGSFDPFDEIADITEEFGLWSHVDGSWGGSIVFNEQIRQTRLKGVERANSIAVNPHKMLGTPVTCSFLLGKDMRQFWQAMTLPAGYLFHNNDPDEIYDLADLTPQCGRKGDALKLYLSWLYYGKEGLSNRIATAYARADESYSSLESSDNITMVSTRPLPCLQVCFYYTPGGRSLSSEQSTKVTQEVVKRSVGRGFMVDYAPGEKGKFFRVVVASGTTSETIKRSVNAIEESGEAVVKES